MIGLKKGKPVLEAGNAHSYKTITYGIACEGGWESLNKSGDAYVHYGGNNKQKDLGPYTLETVCLR